MKKIIITVSLFLAAFSDVKAQWTTSANATNTNTGYVGVSTGLYVTDGTYTLSSVGAGSALFGRTTASGTFIPASLNPGYNLSLTLDQPNARMQIINGNSDQGGGFSRPGVNTGETRFYSNPNYNSSQNFMTFYNYTKECMRILPNGYVGIGTTYPQNLLSLNSPASPTVSQMKLTANGGGSLSAMTYSSDNVSLGFDADWTSPNWTARNATVAWIYKINGALKVLGSAGNSVGGTVAGQNTLMHIDIATGNVGIGSSSPDAKLAIRGNIHATEVKVDANGPPPDYVFRSDYKLLELKKIKDYINKNQHLPEIPSAKEMEKEGINLSEMNMLLLKKVEELTIHLIKNNERLEAQNRRIQKLELGKRKK